MNIIRIIEDKHFENDQSMSFALMEDDPITKTKVGGHVVGIAREGEGSQEGGMR